MSNTPLPLSHVISSVSPWGPQDPFCVGNLDITSIDTSALNFNDSSELTHVFLDSDNVENLFVCTCPVALLELRPRIPLPVSYYFSYNLNPLARLSEPPLNFLSSDSSISECCLHGSPCHISLNPSLKSPHHRYQKVVHNPIQTSSISTFDKNVSNLCIVKPYLQEPVTTSHTSVDSYRTFDTFSMNPGLSQDIFSSLSKNRNDESMAVTSIEHNYSRESSSYHQNYSTVHNSREEEFSHKFSIQTKPEVFKQDVSISSENNFRDFFLQPEELPIGIFSKIYNLQTQDSHRFIVDNEQKNINKDDKVLTNNILSNVSITHHISNENQAFSITNKSSSAMIFNVADIHRPLSPFAVEVSSPLTKLGPGGNPPLPNYSSKLPTKLTPRGLDDSPNICKKKVKITSKHINNEPNDPSGLTNISC